MRASVLAVLLAVLLRRERDEDRLPHHGSSRNVDPAFFETVIVDNYVLSANGDYGNPDLATFDALVKARGQQGYRVWMTNGAPGTALATTVASVREKYPKLALKLRPPTDPSFRIDLGDPVSG